MILEIADIRIQPGQQAAFEEAIQRGLPPSSAEPRASRAGRSTGASKAPSATCCRSSGTRWRTTPWPSAKARYSPNGAPSSAPSSRRRRWSSTSTLLGKSMSRDAPRWRRRARRISTAGPSCATWRGAWPSAARARMPARPGPARLPGRRDRPDAGGAGLRLAAARQPRAARCGPFLIATRHENDGPAHGADVRPWRRHPRPGRERGRAARAPGNWCRTANACTAAARADNKGQHSINIAALASAGRASARGGGLGFNVTWLIETGEETGSPGLAAFCAAQRENWPPTC